MFNEWLAWSGNSRAEAASVIAERCQRQALPLALVALEAQRPVGMVSLVPETTPDGIERPCLAGLMSPGAVEASAPDCVTASCKSRGISTFQPWDSTRLATNTSMHGWVG